MTATLPVTGLHHVKIPVAELARTREWYESLLGLQVEIEFPDDDGPRPIGHGLSPDAGRRQ